MEFEALLALPLLAAVVAHTGVHSTGQGRQQVQEGSG